MPERGVGVNILRANELIARIDQLTTDLHAISIGLELITDGGVVGPKPELTNPELRALFQELEPVLERARRFVEELQTNADRLHGERESFARLIAGIDRAEPAS